MNQKERMKNVSKVGDFLERTIQPRYQVGLTLMLLAAKLLGLPMSYWVVLAPLYAPLSLSLAILFVTVLFMIIDIIRELAEDLLKSLFK